MNNAAGSIAGLFALIALIVGLCSRRAATALKWSAVVGILCVALFLSMLIVYGDSRMIDYSYAVGRFAGYGFAAVIFGMIGYGIRKLFAWVFRLFRKPVSKVPSS